eukprot:101947_1
MACCWRRVVPVVIPAEAAGKKGSEAQQKSEAAFKKGHFLDSLPAIGLEFRELMADRYFNLVAALLSSTRLQAGTHRLSLVGGSTMSLDDASRLLLLDICSLDFTDSDLGALEKIGILDFLEPLLAFPGTNPAMLDSQTLREGWREHGALTHRPWNVRFGAWSLLRLVSYVVADHRQTDAAGHCGQLRAELFATVRRLMGGLQAMCDFEERKLSRRTIASNQSVRASKWACLVCTLVNDTTAEVCSACSTARPLAVSDSRARASSAYSEASDSASVAVRSRGWSAVSARSSVGSGVWWTCARCTYLNEDVTHICAVCDSSKSDGVTESDSDEDEHVLEFQYHHDFDENGILYYLGTAAKTKDWCNPHEEGVVRVTSSSLQYDSEPASAICGRESVRCVSKAEEHQWFMIDFITKKICPTHYTLRHYESWDTEALRFWRFEGSNDGERWYSLRKHKMDCHLNKKGATHTWALPGVSEYYSRFRIKMTGPNSNKHWYLSISGIELYGSMIDASSDSAISDKLAPQNWWDQADIPAAVAEFQGQSRDTPTTVIHLATNNKWQGFMSVNSYSSGRQSFEVKFEVDPPTTNTWRFIVGIVPPKFTSTAPKKYVGSKGWGYIAGTGGKNHNSGQSAKYGDKYGAGDIIRVAMDFEAQTVEFFKNGISQGVSFRDLAGPVHAAVSMTGAGTMATLMVRADSAELSGSRRSAPSASQWLRRTRRAHLADVAGAWLKHNRRNVGTRGRLFRLYLMVFVINLPTVICFIPVVLCVMDLVIR